MSIRRWLAPCSAATSSFSFNCIASEALFCERWIRNTIRNVPIVVPVLMISCHVVEYWKYGPEMAQASTAATARPKAAELPAKRLTRSENRSSHPLRLWLISMRPPQLRRRKTQEQEPHQWRSPDQPGRNRRAVAQLLPGARQMVWKE